MEPRFRREIVSFDPAISRRRRTDDGPKELAIFNEIEGGFLEAGIAVWENNGILR